MLKDESKLRECPCCGSGPAREPGRFTQASFSGVEVMDEIYHPYVWCGTCCLRTRSCDSVAEATAAWNTRTPPAQAEASTLPDIGPDPFKGSLEEYTLANAEKRLRDAFTVQQQGIPDQTALVWRCDLLKLFYELPRLRSIEEDWREARAAPPTTPAVKSESADRGKFWRHVKRGTVYEKIGVAELQCATGQNPGEGEGLVIYRGEDGKLWARMADEFHDGRFTAIDGETT